MECASVVHRPTLILQDRRTAPVAPLTADDRMYNIVYDPSFMVNVKLRA